MNISAITEPKSSDNRLDTTSFPSSMDQASDPNFGSGQTSICFSLPLEHSNSYSLPNSSLFKEETISPDPINPNVNLMIEVDDMNFSSQNVLKEFSRESSHELPTDPIDLPVMQNMQKQDKNSISTVFDHHQHLQIEHDSHLENHPQLENHPRLENGQNKQEQVQDQVTEHEHEKQEPFSQKHALHHHYHHHHNPLNHLQQQQQQQQILQQKQQKYKQQLPQQQSAKIDPPPDLPFQQLQSVFPISMEASTATEAGYVIRTCRGLAEHKPGCKCKPCRGKRAREEKPGWPDDVRPPNGRILLFKTESPDENASEPSTESLTFSAARNLCKAVRRRENEARERNKKARKSSMQDYFQNCL